MYVSYALFCEGPTDYVYMEVIISKLLDEIVANDGTRPMDIAGQPVVRLGRLGRDVETVGKEACASHDAFHFVFIHADTGGPAQENLLEHRSFAYCREMHRLCDWPCERCIVMTPRRETEAWILLDATAVGGSLGYRGNLHSLGLPTKANQIEKLPDPKATLRDIASAVRGRRRQETASDLYPAIANRQSINKLRKAKSFREFEERVRNGLKSYGAIR